MLRYVSVLLAMGCVILPKGSNAQTCGDNETYSEFFTLTDYYDETASGVDGWGEGAVTLAESTATGSGGGEGGFPDNHGLPLDGFAPSVQLDDLNGDGLAEVIMLITEPSCHIHFCTNEGVDEGEFQGWDCGVEGEDSWDDREIDQPTTCSGGVQLIQGDFDGDNDKDLLFVVLNAVDTIGNISEAYLYENLGIVGELVDWGEKVNVTLDFQGTLFGGNLSDPIGISWHYSSNEPGYVIDWDEDGRDELIMGSSYDTLNQVLLFNLDTTISNGFSAPQVIIPDAGMTMTIASALNAATEHSKCPASPITRGISLVLAGDFDKDGDNDIVIGSVSQTNVKNFENDGTDNFSALPDFEYNVSDDERGGVATGEVLDYDGDGDLDIIIARNGKHDYSTASNMTCGGAGGFARLFENDGEGNFSQGIQIAYVGEDADWTVQGDIDGDGQMDLLIGDTDPPGNPEDMLFLATSGAGLSGVEGGGAVVTIEGYNPTGVAQSTVVDSVDGATHAIVSATILTFSTNNVSPPTTDIELFLSNDGGETWEEVLPEEYPPTSEQHDFQSYGHDLKWKANLSAEADLADGQLASKTPELNELSIQYRVVPRRRYSRSGMALGTVGDEEYLMAASYYYPGFQAHLTAYDITDLTRGGAAESMERVDTHADVTIAWDAGVQLQSTNGADRNLFAAYASGDTGPVDDRVELTVANLESTTPTLIDMMSVTTEEGTAVINFVRDGMGSSDDWKLYDVGHSSPVFVGAPSGDEDYYGTGYDTFKTDEEDRTPMVYIGANDGFLHAFKASDGVEVWGLVPKNLLSKLKLQRALSGSTEIYEHHHFVDGSVVVQDVYDETAAEWKTLLVTGQALGQGLQNNNYYFAVDVTDPLNPLPLWEFTDPWDTPITPCTTPTEDESDECGGEGSGNQCCQFVYGGVNQPEYYCSPIGAGCDPAPDPVLGETWSPPAFARVTVEGEERWLVFFGSGYNNRGIANVGRSVYALHAVTGTLLGRWDLTDLAEGAENPSTIDNTVPGGVAVTDIDGDGDVDRVYVGDLEGRLYKMDVSQNGTIDVATGFISTTDWPGCMLFDAGDQDGDGTRNWAPIVTKPAFSYVNDDDLPNVYFGVGGDDRAPGDVLYRFYSVHDDDAPGTCRGTPKYEADLSIDYAEWIIGDGVTNEAEPKVLDPTDAEGTLGDKYWSDPVVVNNSIVYFASLSGDIESVDPCDIIDGTTSKFYAYAVRRFVDNQGLTHRVGESIFTKWVEAYSKIRKSVLYRDQASEPWTSKSSSDVTAAKSDVFIQEVTGDAVGEQPPIRRVVDVGASTGDKQMRVLQWREVPLD